jgi:hypothetical protein
MFDFAKTGIPVDPHGRVEQRVPCPHCDRGPKDDAMGVNIETGAFHCFRCGWKGRAGGESTAPTHPVTQLDAAAALAIAARKRERLRQTWSESLALTHPGARAVRRYLESRALGDVLISPPACLRAHPALPYYERFNPRPIGTFPAMLALFTSAPGAPLTIHTTYLRHDGCAKADVPNPKKLMPIPEGRAKGGAIRLHSARGGILGVAEGIESALSLHLLRKVPVWAAYCADNVAALHFPEDLRQLQVGVDIDESGKGGEAASALAQRVRRYAPHTKVLYVLPELPGPGDLNDELRRRASDLR